MMKPRPLPTVADLPRLNAAQLQATHRLMFGAEHPIANCQHLRRKIAWHLQAEKEGGLPEVVRQRAIAIARDVPLRVRIAENLSKRPREIPADQALTSTVVQTRDARLPMPGSLIAKKYKDRTLVVKVLDDGFEYEGRRFRSLSNIAAEITGTHWNGFAFFGVDKEARRAS
ncbi:MAG: DUF2924 domain-containing protein [Chloroflexi bacterium]|nr:DUF2924 domain-containing protein [Chloroflexota bacterium]